MEILKLLNDTYQTCKGYPLKCCCLLNAKSLKSYVTTKKEKKSNPSNTRMLSKDLREIDELIKEDENIHSILKDKPRLPEHRERTQTVYTSHKTVKEVKYEDFCKRNWRIYGARGCEALSDGLPRRASYRRR